MFFENIQLTKTEKNIFERFGLPTSKYQIRHLIGCSINKYKKTISRDMKKFKKICSEVFFNSVSLTILPDIEAVTVPTAVYNASFTSSSLDCLTPIGPNSIAESCADSLSNSGTSSFDSQLFPKLRNDQLTPRKKVLKQRLSILANEVATKSPKHKKDLKTLREKIRSKPYRLKQLNQTIARKEITTRQLREKLNKNCSNLKLKQLQNANLYLKRQLVSAQNQLSSVTAILKKQLVDKNVEIQVLQNDMLILQEKLESIQETEQNSRHFKSYSTSIRALIYDMLMCHVPSHSVPLLLHKIGEHTGYYFSDIPHCTTVEQMMRELGVISDLQTAEIALSTKDLTLGFDATTQEGIHENAVHFTTQTKCVVVAIDQLAGSTANDYQSHITQSIDHLAKLYCDFYQQKYLELRSTIISNISNTMSDQVATNHATVTKLNNLWQKSLNELNCHLHPLDTITSACKSSLKALETSQGNLFGKNCVAANIVVQLNKLRYKDGKGDPKGFVQRIQNREKTESREIEKKLRRSREKIGVSIIFCYKN
ncbi:uncharacterized protein LOC136093528 [Hydra vulgaris]|uniref:uncharacterized protein LOC136093528 n=1 Tax=Hydra vulgaris TaxID=6087 RepID=UPI0032EA4E71